MIAGVDSGLSIEDSEALASVVPGAELFYSDFAFYLHAASLFKSGSLVCHDVHFSQLALSVAGPDADTTELWYSIIKGYTDLAGYDDAYASLIACPHERLYVISLLVRRSSCLLRVNWLQEARMC